MNDHHIKNVVFDIGNVFVRWSPIEICRLTFGDNGDIATHAETIFTHDLWLALNKGLFSEAEVKTQYHQLLGYSPDLLDQLFYYIKETQIQIYGSFELFKAIKNAGYKTFALTDNVFEIVEYLKQRYVITSYSIHYTKLYDMSLIEQLKEQQKAAMRAKDKMRLGAIRMLLAAVKQQEIDGRKTLKNTTTLIVLKKNLVCFIVNNKGT